MDEDLDVIQVIGSFGIYHGLIVVLACVRAYPMAWSSLMSPLMAADVPHWCAPPDKTINSTWWKDNGVPKTTKGNPDQCSMYRWSESTGLDTNFTVACTHGWSYDKSEFGETATSEWDLVCRDSWQQSILQSTIFAGSMLGVLVFARISDHSGRKVAFIVGIGALLLTGLSAAFVKQFWLFNLLRLFMSSATSGITAATTAIFMEIMPEKDRLYMNVGFGMGFSIPLLFIPLLSYYLRDFRHMQLAVGLSGFFVLPFIFVMQESPKWLLTKRRLPEAEQVIVRILKRNRRTIPEMKDVMTKLAKRAESDIAKQSSNLGYVDLLRIPVLRRNIIYQSLSWFSYGVLFTYIALNAHRLPGSAHLNFAISTFAEFPSAIVGMYLIRKYRRRQTQIFTAIGTLVFFNVVFFLDESYRWTKTYGAAIIRFFLITDSYIKWVTVHEINPTTARSASFAVCMISSRMGGLLGSSLKDIGDWTSPWIIYAVFILLSAFMILGATKLPETLNEKLPDTVEDVKRFSKMKDINLRDILAHPSA